MGQRAEDRSFVPITRGRDRYRNRYRKAHKIDSDFNADPDSNAFDLRVAPLFFRNSTARQACLLLLWQRPNKPEAKIIGLARLPATATES